MTSRLRAIGELFERWPVVRQWRAQDFAAQGATAASARTEALRPRTETADKVVQSVCPYCAVGCGQLVHVKDRTVINIEGDPASPISRGRLCPKGAASMSLVNNPDRLTRIKYRRPYGTEWEELSLDRAMDMIADRIIDTRARTWQDTDEHGVPLRRTLGFAHLGGATLDIEENYLLKKLYTALGAIQIENQARI
jgi:formate dehydrogenase major subunit